ncbi:Efflux pump himE [Paramyrothecium foliicola]|nr:Efflux pump himE [Paramyrothecium foliicola]
MSSAQYSLPGNAFFAAAYGLLLPPQIFFGIKYKTWGFLFGMFAGLILEVIAFIGRVQLHHGDGSFVMYILPITVGPAFISASVYLCLARIIKVFGEHLSYFRPRTITITFMVLDFFALLLQSAGGAMVGGDDLTREEFDRALSILQAGLSIHLAAIIIYSAISCHFAFSVYKNKSRWSESFSSLQQSRKFRLFLIALAIATFCIFVRTAYRVAELSQGIDSDIANNEGLFFALEAVLILIACICLTVFHPGLAFQRRWAEANFQLKTRKKNQHEELSSSSSRQQV